MNSTVGFETQNANLSIPVENSISQSRYTLFQTIVIAWIACCLGLITVVGNILVMISFKIDKQLQTISNYFLLSLAVADFVIGSFSMPLFTIYQLFGYWPFGSRLCDGWLSLDYLASNASVLNLLIISFDRYFSVTRPLTYRARRTTRRAALMISSAWGISLLLWPPWIYAWPYIEGKRTVPPNMCYIQFIETNHYITFGTAIAAFYVPVSIMLFLYWQIWLETEKRQRDLSQLQAGKKDSSRRSNSSDEAADNEEIQKIRPEGCICPDDLYQLPTCPANHHQSQFSLWVRRKWRCVSGPYYSCIKFLKIDRDVDDLDEMDEDHGNSPGCTTPASVETPLQSSVSRCTSLSILKDPITQTPSFKSDPSINIHVIKDPPLHLRFVSGKSESIDSEIQNFQQISPHEGIGSNGKFGYDSVYTILIHIPQEQDGKNGSIRMIQEPGPLPPLPINPKGKFTPSTADKTSPNSERRKSAVVPPLNAKLIPKTIPSGKYSSNSLASSAITVPVAQKKKKKKNAEKKQEKKAAKTLSAILLAFIVTWTPYNILVLFKTILVKEEAIPAVMWDMAYYLCYINSTINPMCYALCNASFRRTYVRILTCKWNNSRRQAVNRVYYN